MHSATLAPASVPGPLSALRALRREPSIARYSAPRRRTAVDTREAGSLLRLASVMLVGTLLLEIAGLVVLLTL
ncbi:MAG TPA: hypothetical protein VIL55_15980 [Naasia sp.]|jgi:hypothetical protein